MTSTIAAALALALAGPIPLCAAESDPRIDENGRDRAVYPPPRHFDHLHLKLAIDIPSMDEPSMRAVETLTITPIGKPRDTLILNAVQMTIESVSLAGRPVAFNHEQGLLTISLPRPVEIGAKADVVIEYSKELGKSRGTGLTWSAGDPDEASETDRAPQIHTQGQPEFNRTWFPCHDFPNERFTTEMLVTVDSGFQVCSNGRLVGQKRAEGGDGRGTWHWLQDKPHAAYLVVLVVGKFSIVGLDARKAGLSRPVPLYLYAPIGSEESARAAYARTPEMIGFFERWFDEPYPWDKYAQLLVRNFMAGGMENTSATTMQADSAFADPGSQDDIIAHEAAHQWTGDLVTCKSWEHIWLNEGWATYAEALWAEHDAREDPAKARRAYQRQIAGSITSERLMNRTYAPEFPALASNRYNAPMEVFVRANNAYSKGAIVLHMLRMRLGDEVFQRAVRTYIDRFRLREVETDDFRRVLEEVSGLSLERFFDQWVRRPGTPRLTFEYSWNDAASELTVSARQTQQINADNPAFALSLPIEAEFADGQKSRLTFDIDTQAATRRYPLPSRPVDLTIDPDLSVVAATHVAKPLSMWLRQLEHDSLFAQLQAVEHLAAFDDPGAGQALLRVALRHDADQLLRRAASSAHNARSMRITLSRWLSPAGPSARHAMIAR